MAQIEREDTQLVDTAIKTASLAILGTLLIPLRRKFERDLDINNTIKKR
jgi:hypothetical protein